MSEQSDALNKLAREKGIQVDSPVQPLPGFETSTDRPELPLVPLPRGGHVLRDFSKAVGAIVSQNGVYRREAVPVTIDRESGRIEDMDSVRFQSYVENQMYCYVERFSRAGAGKEHTTMTVGEAAGCLRSDAFRYQQRKLQRVNFAQLPVMRKDGRMELLPDGYDQESEIFTMKSGIDLDESQTLEGAILFLRSFLKEFPFADERSMAAHMTAMLAMFGPSLQPMGAKRLNFVYRANMQRAGKGLLAHMAIVPPCGPASVQTIPDAREEFKKILDTEALNGSSYIFLDEIERKLVNRTLNSFLTTNLWTGRLFNSQKKFSVPQNSIVFMTGNNVELSGDLAGRCLLVDLHVSDADAQSRAIDHPIDELYLARPEVRRDILSALWALVRAWDKAGRPKPASVFQGFKTFSDIFGGIVEFAGFGNPMKSAAADVDSDFADMSAVVEKLSEGVVMAVYDFHEIIEVCRELNAFEWHLEGKMGKAMVMGKETDVFRLTASNNSWFGKLFSGQYGGTEFVLSDGRRVRFGARGRNRGRRYTVEVITGNTGAV